MSGEHLTFEQMECATLGRKLTSSARDHLQLCYECKETLEVFRTLRQDQAEAAPAGHVCLGPEDFAEMANREGRESLLMRAAECPSCAALLEAVFADSETHATEDSVPRAAVRHSLLQVPPPRKIWTVSTWIAVAATLAITVSSAIWLVRSRQVSTSTLLAQAYTSDRPFEFRVPDHGYGVVRQQRSGQTSVFSRPRSLADAEESVRERLRQHPNDFELLSLKGRAELMEGQFEAAIATLTAVNNRSATADSLNDLACAYALRGDVEKRTEDYARAAELLLKAARIDPKQPRIPFNLGLVYKKLWLIDEAIGAWRSFLALDERSEWATEARRRLAAIEEIRRRKEGALHDATAGPDALRASAPSSELEFEAYLNDFWTRWLIAPNPTARWREGLAWYANQVRLRHRDSLLELAVKTAEEGNLLAFKSLAVAIRANTEGRYEVALAAAIKSERLLRDPALKLRALAERMTSLQRSDRNQDCVNAGLKVAKQQGDRVVWPFIQSQLDLAACLGKQGQVADAQRLIRLAIRNSTQSGYRLLNLRALGFECTFNVSIGATGSVWAAGVKGFETYWKTGASVNRFHQFAFDLSRASRQAEWWELGTVLTRSYINASQRIPNRSMEALGTMNLAALLEEAGHLPESNAVLEGASALIDSIEDPRVRNTYRVEAGVARARAGAESEPAAAIALLQDIAPDSLPSELLKRRLRQVYGHALLQLGKWDEARAQLHVAFAWIETAKTLPNAQRLELLSVAEPMLRDLVHIEWIYRHNPRSAFNLWREFRAVAAGSAVSEHALVRGEAQVYLLTDRDKVRGWLLDFEDIVEIESSRSAGQIHRQAEEFLAICSTPTSDAKSVRIAGLRLAEDLFGSAGERLRLSRNWRIDADGWLAAIPFEALTMPDGRFAEQDHVISFGNVRKWEAHAPITAFVVSVPSATGFEGNRLPYQESAERESASIARRFTTTVAAGVTLAPDDVSRGLQKAELFHFAGHGWSNGGGGGLLLGNDAAGNNSIYTSADLIQQRLRNCRLAVLSACLTGQGESSGPTNAQSLVRAMLGAGVQNVIASRWNADSEAAEKLFDLFYGNLKGGMDPADSLHSAALALAGAIPFRHPYYWAAFSLFT